MNSGQKVAAVFAVIGAITMGSFVLSAATGADKNKPAEQTEEQKIRNDPAKLSQYKADIQTGIHDVIVYRENGELEKSCTKARETSVLMDIVGDDDASAKMKRFIKSECPSEN